MVYDWSFGEPGSCPNSDHKKKLHRGKTLARRRETRTVKGFRGQPVTVTTFFDTVHCAFCDAVTEQEWLPA